MRVMCQFNFTDLLQVCDCSYPNARRYVRRLLGAGYLRLLHEATGPGDQNRYLLVRNTGPKPPIPRRNESAVYDENNGETYPEQFGETARDRAWALIRQRQPFRLADLIEAGLQRANGYKYLACLLEAGYIVQITATKPGPGGHPAEYQLCHDPGPLTPIEQRNGSVHDPNAPPAHQTTDQTTDQ